MLLYKILKTLILLFQVMDSSQSRYYNSSSVPTDLTHPGYHSDKRSEYEAGRSHAHEEKRAQPPPLLSPKSQGEATRKSSESIFRPFEKVGQAEQLNSYHQYSKSATSSKGSDLLVPNYRSSADREQGSDSRDRKKPTSAEIKGPVSQKVESAKDYSRKQAKLALNNNIGYGNHHVECFNFKSLAMEKTNLHRPEPKNDVSVARCEPSLGAVVADVERTRSKLDMREEKLRVARLNGACCSDSEEEEEELSEEEDDRRRLHRCMMVTEGPPLPLELTLPKIKLFRFLGLVSQRRRKGN